MLEPETEGRAWEEQLVLDDASYRAQLGYLLERSAFYREKLAGAGIESAAIAGGIEEIARLPLTEKSELRATVTPDNPIGSHLCAEPSEIARIYSTSGTTGAPSYIPLTARDLDDWVTGSARSYAASGVEAGQDRLDPTRGVRRRRRARVVRPPPARHVLVGAGNMERLVPAIEPSGRGRGADAVVRSASRRGADERGGICARRASAAC
jgi:phenylacetate-CoA ligase